MDKTFDKFLLDLEGERNCQDLQRPAANQNNEHEEVQQRNFDLECLEKELGVMQSSLDETYVDTEQIPQLYHRAQSVVKDLETTERQLHERSTEISLSSERIVKAEKNISTLSEKFQKMVGDHPLGLDIGAIFEPSLEQANDMKKNTVQVVSEAVNSFGIQNLIVEVTKIAQQRKRRSNLLLERDACRSLSEEISCDLDKLNEEYAKLCAEKENLQNVLRKKKETIGNWTSEAKRLQEQIEICHHEVDVKQVIADQTKLEHNNIKSSLEATQSKYSLLSEQKKQLQEKGYEVKEKLSQETAKYKEHKESFIEKIAKSIERKQAILADLKQRQINFTADLKKIQDELNHVNRLRERFSRKEAGTDGLGDKINSIQEKIIFVKEAIEAINTKRECYRLESERKINGKKTDLLEMEKKIEGKQNELVNLESILEDIQSTINKKIEMRDSLAQEVESLNNAQKTPERYLKPVSTSTPLTNTSSTICREKEAAPRKSKAGRLTKSKRGGRKRS